MAGIVKHTTTALTEQAKVRADSAVLASAAAQWCLDDGVREKAAVSSGLFDGVARGKIRGALRALESRAAALSLRPFEVTTTN